MGNNASNPEDWPKEVPCFSEEHISQLLDPNTRLDSDEVDVDTIITNSHSFPIEFPIQTIKCQFLKEKGVLPEDLHRNINSTYPILHESALPLFLQFLYHKKRFGSELERKLYENFTVQKLVDRLLTKRAVVFCGRFDKFMLMDGLGNSNAWEIIGTADEKPPRVLENCLSYDEIKLSALLSVSSYTHFINNGSRDNCGKYCYNRDEVEDHGIIIGLIGPRLEKPEVMEYQETIVTKEQNVQGKGYGRLFVPTLKGIFLNFYGELSSTYDELKSEFKNQKKYYPLTDGQYFNNDVYAKRLALSLDTLLIEANDRARQAGKMAYVHVVGIGLGVWRISSHQSGLFMDVFCRRLGFLSDNLHHVSDICFSYIGSSSCGKYKNGDKMPIAGHPNGGIKIHITLDNPHGKLTGDNQGKLRVVSYAWDGNALPGNEFWLGQLASSGDPAAACSTQVAELHNPHINPKVSGANLKIATLKGVVSFDEYVKKIKPV